MSKKLLLCLVIASTLIFSGCLIKGRVVDGNGAGVAGVLVTLSGDAFTNTATNSDGEYQFGTLANLLEAGNYTVRPSSSGYGFNPPSRYLTIRSQGLENGDVVPWPVIGINFVANHTTTGAIIIDHACTDITLIPQSAIEQAKSTLHISYGHTSHGSQLTDGMTGLVEFANSGGLGLCLPADIFAWNDGGTANALDLHDYFQDGDLGNPDRTTWAQRTRDYLNDPANSDVNVIIWSWCGQVDASEEDINLYLSLMNQLEIDYPGVHFVYMTGHANGTGEAGNVHLRNRQIRNYCEANGKILYDFYDIECYDPDGNYFGDRYVLDSCGYDGDGNGNPWDDSANWAIEWQKSHTEGVDWYDCESAHSQPLNANRKAYAAWWLWARIGGW